jgi:hypothetical protein
MHERTVEIREFASNVQLHIALSIEGWPRLCRPHPRLQFPGTQAFSRNANKLPISDASAGPEKPTRFSAHNPVHQNACVLWEVGIGRERSKRRKARSEIQRLLSRCFTFASALATSESDGDPLLSQSNDVFLGAVHDGQKFGLFRFRHAELVERLLKVVEERLPFLFGDP